MITCEMLRKVMWVWQYSYSLRKRLKAINRNGVNYVSRVFIQLMSVPEKYFDYHS